MKPIERISVVEQVMERLKEYIVENQIEPGDKIPTEKEICEMLGTGRSTVREAYRMLQAQGILEAQRGKGVYFKRLQEETKEAEVVEWFKSNGQRVADYIEVRSGIEIMAIKLSVHRFNPKDIQELKEIHERGMREVKAETAKRKKAIKMALYDEEFHHKITRITKNDLLIKIEKIISECLAEYRNQTFLLDENVNRANKSHEKIVNALVNKDMSEAILQMTLHLEDSLEDMENIKSL